MKFLLSVCLLLHLPVAALGESVVHNWYFQFYTGDTVCRVSGVETNESKKTTVIEHAFGRYLGDTFVVDSRVESDSGALIMSGSTRWKQVGDHFEADITAGAARYHGVLRLHPSQTAVVEIFSGTTKMNRTESYIRDGTLYGRTEIYDATGNVVTVCDSECRKNGYDP